jgi:hypothetical protein
VSLKSVLKWAAVAFVIWWVVQQPSNASHLVHNIGDLLSRLATGFAGFVTSI